MGGSIRVWLAPVLALSLGLACWWALQPTTAPPTEPLSMEVLAEKVQTRRGVKFGPAFRLQPVAESEIERHFEKRFPPEVAKFRRQAWVAAGFRWEPDWPEAQAMAGLASDAAGAFYDADTQIFYFPTADAPVVRPMQLAKLTHALAASLIESAHGPCPELGGPNDDAALAKSTLLAADAGATAVDCLLDVAVPQAPRDAAALPMFYAAPKFLRELMSFPRGTAFLLEDHPGFPNFQAAWQAPPSSTAVLLQGRMLPANQPQTPSLAGQTPLFTGVMGQFAIQCLLRSQLTTPVAKAASEGWCGDAFALFPNNHFLWHTRWKSPEAALAFAQAECQVLSMALALNGQQEPESPPVASQAVDLQNLPEGTSQTLTQISEQAKVGTAFPTDAKDFQPWTAQARGHFLELSLFPDSCEVRLSHRTEAHVK